MQARTRKTYFLPCFVEPKDTRRCLSLLREEILPIANLFCYGQVKSAYGSGQFIKDLRGGLEEEEKLILSEIGSREEVYDSIKAFLGKGH